MAFSYPYLSLESVYLQHTSKWFIHYTLQIISSWEYRAVFNNIRLLFYEYINTDLEYIYWKTDSRILGELIEELLVLSNNAILKQTNVLQILPSNHSIRRTLNPDTTLCVHFVCVVQNINQSTPELLQR